MKKIILSLVLLTLCNCSERMTKEFVFENSTTESKTQIVENWVVNPPKLIAFKNKRVEDIQDTTYLYWLTIKANSVANLNSNKYFSIDSVGIKFLDIDSISWKKPSRVVPYKESKKETYLAYDFFKDEGILIPESISKIKIFFNAILTDTITNEISRHEVSFDMIRLDTTNIVPFMIH